MNTIIQAKITKLQEVLTKIPEISYVGDPVLRQTTTQVSIPEGTIIGEQLGKVLLEYRSITGLGRGLAAPQIGINKAVFVTYVNDVLQTFINPVIVEASTENNYYRELCISSGIIAAEVKRPIWITLEWTNPDGIKHQEKVDNFLARLYQHEEAHLRGIVNLDQAVTGSLQFVTFDPAKEALRPTSLYKTSDPTATQTS